MELVTVTLTMTVRADEVALLHETYLQGWFGHPVGSACRGFDVAYRREERPADKTEVDRYLSSFPPED